VAKQKGSVSTIRKKLINNADENKLVNHLLSSITEYISNFHDKLAISIQIEDQFECEKRKSGQFYSELIVSGLENTIDENFGLLVTALSYLTIEIIHEKSVFDFQPEMDLFSEEEIEFFDSCTEKFIHKNSGTKISTSFDCHIGFFGGNVVHFAGHIKRAALHQIDITTVRATIQVHGFDDNSKEIKGTIVAGELAGNKIVLHTNLHDIFVQAARGYIECMKFSCLYKEKANKTGGNIVNELLAFNPLP
jgi:hypothetical protein